ncbi:MAG: carbamate kinase, partial [Deltaproteobacteria bacterium]
MYEKLVVIALGGNAIKQADEKGTTQEQFDNIDITAKQIARICKAGFLQVLTHGNGPQAGALLIQQEEAKDIVPPQTLASCVAMTQGQIGWMFQNRIGYHFSQQDLNYPVTTMITQVVIDKDDPDFKNPSKPVGPFYSKEEAMALKNTKGYRVKEAKPGQKKGWRRVVPSPAPVDIYENKAIKQLLDIEALVIVSGGGGIPIVKEDDGSYTGIDAVIDKDLTANTLGQVLNADYLLVLTDVENAYINFNKPDQKALGT